MRLQPLAAAPNRSAALGFQPRQPPNGVWRQFLSYYRPHVGLLVADLGCAVLIAATTLALPLCANFVVKRLSAVGPTPAVMQAVWAMGATMLALLALQALATMFVDYQGHVMGAKMEARLRSELFAHYQALPFGFFDSQRVGQLMSRISNDLFSMSELFHHGPEDAAIAALKLAGALAILFAIDRPMTLMIVALLPFALAYSLYFGERMNRALLEAKVRMAEINERVEDSLSGIRVVKAFGGEAAEIARFARTNERFLETRRFGYLSEAWFSVGLTTFAQGVTVAAIVLGAEAIARQRLGVADLLTYLLCVAILVDPIQRAANIARLWQEGLTGFVRVRELMSLEPERSQPLAAALRPRLCGAVAFRGVSFGYPGAGRRVLEDLSLEVRSGELVALTGASGAGKSTLVSLIPRFYEPCAGKVTIDGIDVRALPLATLRAAVGMVQQDVYLFAGTVAENLRYARPGATQAELVDAAGRAQAHEFIMHLPMGYETDIGQRGVKLSGGQKQRLTIARVFLKNPPILIFDEATSALDPQSERALQEGLRALAVGRTTLVVAHRLSTIRRADRIVVLADGRIAEEGSHEALLAAGGAYARLYEAQARL